MTSIKTAHDTKADVCARRLRESMGSVPAGLTVFFASPGQVLEAQQAFGTEFGPAIGCSTAGEIASGVMDKHSVVAMALPRDLVPHVAVAAIEDLGDPDAVSKALASLEAQVGRPLHELDLGTHVGIVLLDGLSLAEERIMEQLGDRTDLLFVGGSAGDDLAFCRTTVCAQGRALEHGGVLAILHCPAGYRLLKTESFMPTGKTLTATAVEEGSRTVLEFDGEPAAVAYARALGTDVAALPGLFMHYPLGLMMGDEPYVRSPRALARGGAVSFYCNIKKGMELAVLESTDIVGGTRADLESLTAQMHGLAGIVNFHCILRTLELESRGQCQAYGDLFTHVPTIGFSTYGEEYMGHINQTSTMLLFQADGTGR